MKDCNKKLEEFIFNWAKQYKYLDEQGTLNGKDSYDVGYDIKADIENSHFYQAPKDMYDIWYDLFLEEDILPILITLGAAKSE